MKILGLRDQRARRRIGINRNGQAEQRYRRNQAHRQPFRGAHS